MSSLFGSILLLLGAGFLLVAAIGVLRMPDLFMRMQAATKASTLGVGFLVLAVAIHFNDLTISVRALLIILFLFVTAPVAAHVIGRSSYFVGVPLWDETIIDELRGRYDTKTHRLRGPSHSAMTEDQEQTAMAGQEHEGTGEAGHRADTARGQHNRQEVG